MLAQITLTVIAHIHAIDRDAALLNVVKPRDQTDHTGFARTGRTNEGHTLARFDVKVDAAQDPILRRDFLADRLVREPNILERDLAAKTTLEHFCVRFVVDNFGLVKNPEDAFGARHRRLQGVQHVA